MQHSSLPWTLTVDEGHGGDVGHLCYIDCADQCPVMAKRGYPRMTSVVDPDSGIAWKEDAEFIVRAVNAHDDLIEVLRATIRWAESRCPVMHETPDPCPLCDATVAAGRCKAVDETIPGRLLNDMRDALAKAERNPVPEGVG